MHIRQRTRQRIATGLMILFLALALVPIYQILAKMSPGGRFVQLCSAMGIQTVWVADEADGGLPLLKANAKVNSIIGAESIGASGSASAAAKNAPNLTSPSSISSPFGSCEFCWTSVLATVLPLALVLVFGLPTTQLIAPVPQTQAFQSFLRQWHARPRAPPLAF